MKDIEQYKTHLTAPGFEQHMASFRRQHVTQWLQAYAGKVVLDVGIGPDPLFLHWQDFAVYYGVEPVPAFYEQATQHLKILDQQVKVHLLHGPLETVSQALQGNSYDAILLSGVLHEVENAQALLAAVYSLCSNHTVVHINVPNARSFHRLLAKAAGLIEDVHERSERMEQLQQHRLFDKESLTTFVQQQGFKVVDSGSYFIKPFTHEQMQAMLDHGIITDQVLQGLDKLAALLPEMGAEVYVNVKKA